MADQEKEYDNKLEIPLEDPSLPLAMCFSKVLTNACVPRKVSRKERRLKVKLMARIEKNGQPVVLSECYSEKFYIVSNHKQLSLKARKLRERLVKRNKNQKPKLVPPRDLHFGIRNIAEEQVQDRNFMGGNVEEGRYPVVYYNADHFKNLHSIETMWVELCLVEPETPISDAPLIVEPLSESHIVSMLEEGALNHRFEIDLEQSTESGNTMTVLEPYSLDLATSIDPANPIFPPYSIDSNSNYATYSIDPENPIDPEYPLDPANPIYTEYSLDPANPIYEEHSLDPESPIYEAHYFDPEIPIDPANPQVLGQQFNPLLLDFQREIVYQDLMSMPDDAFDSMEEGHLKEIMYWI